MLDVVVITGLSGAGRSSASGYLEDLGWYVIDNLPPVLVPSLADLVGVERVGLVEGSGRYHGELLPALRELREKGAKVRIVFLEANTSQLIKRYKSTRRPHPFDDGSASIERIIELEREAMAGLKAEADVVIDTSEMNVHDLRRRFTQMFGEGTDGMLSTRVVSFGYKHGLPIDVDFVFDCRFLPNPHWVEALRPLSGKDEPVAAYLDDQPVAGDFIAMIGSMLELLLPAFNAEGKAYLTVAFGCTGGHHRSVYVAERVAELLRGLDQTPTVTHRDIEL